MTARLLYHFDLFCIIFVIIEKRLPHAKLILTHPCVCFLNSLGNTGLEAKRLPTLTNSTEVRPSGENGARWCVPAETVTNDEHTNPNKIMKSSMRQFKTVSNANLR